MGAVILYTIVPIEDVLQGADPLTLAVPGVNGCGKPGAPMEMPIGDRRLVVMPERDGTARVVRLISTNPADYLDARWQPGALVKL